LIVQLFFDAVSVAELM